MFGALRNIAYLHAIHRLIVIDKLKKPPLTRHKTATPTTTNTQQHALKQMIEKLPKVTLT